jgi:hypothetical protein
LYNIGWTLGEVNFLFSLSFSLSLSLNLPWFSILTCNFLFWTKI